MKKTRQRFITKKDLYLSPAIALALISFSVLFTWVFSKNVSSLRVLEFVVVAYVLLMILTIIFLKIIRTTFPFKEGIFTATNHGKEIYIWNLYVFLCITNLSLFYTSNLLPIIFRRRFLLLLGAKLENGVFALGGVITDPHMVQIDENSILGDECYISPHAILTLSGGDALLIKKIHLKKNCVIGARAVLLPGVIVGEGATVAPNVVVPMNTIIPPGSQWPPKAII